jgi:hypothetical protein
MVSKKLSLFLDTISKGVRNLFLQLGDFRATGIPPSIVWHSIWGYPLLALLRFLIQTGVSMIMKCKLGDALAMTVEVLRHVF